MKQLSTALLALTAFALLPQVAQAQSPTLADSATRPFGMSGLTACTAGRVTSLCYTNGTTTKPIVMPIGPANLGYTPLNKAGDTIGGIINAPTPSIATLSKQVATMEAINNFSQGASHYNAAALGLQTGAAAGDQSGALNYAVGTMGAAGGIVDLPCGVIPITGTLSIANNYVLLRGCGQGGTTIQSNFTTGDVLKFNGVYSGIEDVTFAQQVPSGGAVGTTYRASGYTLNMNGPYQWARHISFENCFVCVRMGNTGGGHQTLDQVEMRYITPDATASGSGGVSIRDAVIGGDNWIDRVLIAGSTSTNASTGNLAPPTFGIQIANSGGAFISHVDILGTLNDLLINPGQGQNVAATFVSDAFFDSAQGDNVVIQPTGSGWVFTTHFSNAWLTNTTFPGSSKAGTNGIKLVGSGSSRTPYPIMDTTFTGGFIITTAKSPGTGVLCNDNGVSDTKITGTLISGWGIGANIGCSDVTLADNSIGAYSPFPNYSGTGGPAGNTNGIILNAGVDYINVHGNRMRGNTNNPIADYSIGTHTVIRDNPGYMPPAAAAVSLSGSPATLSAGHAPADFYVFGGAVSSIVANNGNAAIANSSPALVHAEPNESYTLNYTSTPAVTKVGH